MTLYLSLGITGILIGLVWLLMAKSKAEGKLEVRVEQTEQTIREGQIREAIDTRNLADDTSIHDRMREQRDRLSKL